MTLKDALLWPIASLVSSGFKALESLDWYQRNGYPRIASLLGSVGPTHTGRALTDDVVDTCSTVYACTEIIAREIAFLPLHLYEQNDNTRERAKKHPLYRILRRASSQSMTALHFRHALQSNVLLRGNGYAQIIRQSGLDKIMSLDYIDPTRIVKIDIKNGEWIYILRAIGSENGEQRFKQSDIFHVRGPSKNGIEGDSVIARARQSVALAQIQEEYVSKFFAQGGRRPYLLKHPQRFRDDQAFKDFRERWDSQYGTADNFHRSVVLEGGLEYQELGFSMEDAQFLQSRQFSVLEVCRWFLMQPHMVGDLSRATFSNIEHQFLEHIKVTLMYWAVNWEQEIWRQLLSAKDQEMYYAEFDMNALERGDFSTRMAGYSQQLQNGMSSIDEVRGRENMNPLSKGAGRAHHIQLNMQTVPGTGEPTAAELAAMAKTREQPPR